MSSDMSASNDRIRLQVERWRDELLDLTGRNRLLRFRHTKTSSLEVVAPSPQEILDRLLTGRKRELRVHLPPEPETEQPEDLDPTASRVGVGEPSQRTSSSAEVITVTAHLGEGAMWLSFGVLRWRDAGENAAVIALVPVILQGGRLRLSDHEMRINPALLAHFETTFGVDLGDGRYRIESAGIQRYLDELKRDLEPLNARSDDRVGLISQADYEAIEGGALDTAPRILIARTPRAGVLGALVGLDEGQSLPLIPPGRSIVRSAARATRATTDTELITTKETARDIAAACAGLSRRATQEFMDKGLAILYLGIGMLHWSDPADGRAEVQDSPLLLVPIRIESAGRGAEWKVLATEDEPIVNPALWLKLEGDLGLDLPDIVDGEPIAVAELLDRVRAAVASFPAWTVEERAVISTFSFHKEVMYRDLRDNLARIVAHPVVAALGDDPVNAARHESFVFEPDPEAGLDESSPPETSGVILDADASQRQCIAAACAGRSFVMDGPPGTGKSQTIANMIAELIAGGKSVLFVSEKAAALDVVHDRLERVGLHEYTLELHSHKTTRAVVAGELGRSLLSRPRPAPGLTESDLGGVRRRREELSRYAHALNDPIDRLGGRSLHHLLGSIAALQHLPQGPPTTNPPQEPSVISELAERLRSTWEVVERGEEFVWRGATATSWGAAVEQRVLAALGGVAISLADLQAVTDDAAHDLLLEPPAGPRGARELEELLSHLSARPFPVPAEWITAPDWPAILAAGDRQAGRCERYASLGGRARANLGDNWRSLTSHDVDTVPESVDLAIDGAAAARLAEAADALAGQLEDARSTTADCYSLLGLRATDLAPVDIEAASQLAGAIGMPLASWLAVDTALDAAEEAMRVLAPLVGEVRAAREAANGFEPDVLKLDVDALARRFEEEHRGLKKLGSAYREDRDALAATAPTLKRKQAIARIGDALWWRQAERALDAEAHRAEALGSAWSRTATDLPMIEQRLTTARTVLALAGYRVVDRQRFAEVLSEDRAAPGLRGLADRADAALLRLRTSTRASLAPIAGLPLDEGVAAARAAAGALRSAIPVTRAADTVRGSAGTVADALDANAAVAEAARLEDEHATDVAGRAALGEGWSDLTVDAPALRAGLAWTGTVRDRLGHLPSTGVAGRLVTETVSPDTLRGGLERWKTALEPLLTEFDLARRAVVAADLESHFGDAQELVERLRDTRGDIETWTTHAEMIRALQESGLAEAVEFCARERVAGGQVVGVLRRAALEGLADALLAERADVLGPLRSVDRDRLVAEFASRDRRVLGDAAHRVMRAANDQRPNAILGVAQIIANEAQKKKRHMPVAELLSRTAPIAQAVKPCFMMSPLSVSQYLSPDMVFDVVIFDEASQVRPSDAINALYRGSAMIVAGDQKQLPPTSFFEQSTDEGNEWTEDALSEFDSVLDLAKGSGAFRGLSLRWHYRSRHEHLIAFSNHRFYGGQLVTFPSPEQDSADVGVDVLQVEGVYRRGTTRDNPIEAAEIVERVFFHAERGTRAIGIVAFSEAQASLIEEYLRRDQRGDDPRFADLFGGGRLEALFVKNLENVQGDERDLILFSVGYGPDEAGKLTMNFGPLNREGGWRRLNVAITRARKRVEVVCSFGPEALAPGSRTRGVDELRRYLEFGARGVAALQVADGFGAAGGEPESPFEEAIMMVVRSWGYDIVAQVGTAGYRVDLGVRHAGNPGRFALGIECDGAMYHSSRVARDRDRLRGQILEGLGWTLHRIWGPSWYRDRAGEERRLKEAIERAMLDRVVPAVMPPGPRVVVEYEDMALDALPNWTEPYVVAALPLTAQHPDPAEPAAAPELRSRVLHAVTEEGPIVEDVLARRVISVWGALSDRRRQAVSRVLASLVASGALVRHVDAICLPNQATDLVRVPDEDDERTERDVRQVPLVELAEALARMVSEARVVTEDELLRRTARIFGWTRTGSAIQAALSRTIEHLVATGRVARENGTIRPVIARPRAD